MYRRTWFVSYLWVTWGAFPFLISSSEDLRMIAQWKWRCRGCWSYKVVSGIACRPQPFLLCSSCAATCVNVWDMFEQNTLLRLLISQLVIIFRCSSWVYGLFIDIICCVDWWMRCMCMCVCIASGKPFQDGEAQLQLGRMLPLLQVWNTTGN